MQVSAHSGGIAVGSINIMHLGAGRVAIRSAYRRQLQRIAPPQLVDRDAELAELAEFCAAPDGAAYVWWRAGAWAGKTALMSTFALRPPPGVVVIAFCITARLAAQDDRRAFADVVIEQLVALLDEEPPRLLTDATRDAHLLDLLDRAARTCRDRGQRLVLVVDGLDEDRGVTTGPASHSIAALLPAEPPAGMRVIVAGRPDPPIPDDVPPWHPLRDPAIVRALPPSDRAQRVRVMAQQELRHLLHGTPVQAALVGLLVAAGGGLSGNDLAELTDRPLWEVEEILHGPAGRTFSRRGSRWDPDGGSALYLLAHEQLQVAAGEYLGDRLPAYRETLHAWAQRTRERGWPPGTSEYLLSGYFRMVLATADTPRLLGLALDAARHDRMLDVTDGDSAALAEIVAVQRHLLGDEHRDLTALVRIALRAQQLQDRNSTVPDELPVLWARLGNHVRAEGLAGASPASPTRAEMLRIVACLVCDGKLGWAESLIPRISDRPQRTVALAVVAVGHAGAGDPARAEALLRSGADRLPDHDFEQVLGRPAETGVRVQIEAMVRPSELFGVDDRLVEVRTLKESAIDAQEFELAAKLRDEEKRLVDRQPSADQRWDRLATGSLARAMAFAGARMAAAGARDGAEALMRDAQKLAGTIAGGADRVDALAETIRQWPEPDRARWVAPLVGAMHAARQAEDEDEQRTARALAAAAPLLDAGPAARQLASAEAALRRLGDTPGLVATARDLARAGFVHHARVLLADEQVRNAFTDPFALAVHLVAVAQAWFAAAAPDQAGAALSEAEQSARAVAVPLLSAWALVAVASTVADADRERSGALLTEAEHLVRSTAEWNWAPYLVRVAHGCLDAGLAARARAIVEELDLAARTEGRTRQLAALGPIAIALAGTGDLERPARLAKLINFPAHRLTVNGWLAIAYARAGELEVLTGYIERLGKNTDGLPTIAAIALAQAGALGDAETVARSVPDESHSVYLFTHGDRLHSRNSVLAEIVTAAVEQGRLDVAGRVLAAIPDGLHRDAATADLAIGYSNAGDLATADVLWRSVADPGHRGRAQYAFVAGLAEHPAGLAEAERAALSIDDELHRARALALVARHLAHAGNTVHAVRVFARCGMLAADGDGGTRPRILAALAQRIAETGEIEDAERVAAEIDTRTSQAVECLAELATAVGHSGLASKILNRAEAAVGRIEDVPDRAIAAGAVAVALAHARQWTRSDRVFLDAMTAVEADRRSGLHEDLSRAIARRLDQATATSVGRLVALALTTSRWTDYLDVVVRIAPEAVTALGADLDRALEEG
ncbi:UvrB/UvrC motif-containing protein [Dactylosporangium sp. CS-033363]|uniref:UvrB/UvrC motif-containing protein n=1 Tax=Dactylosporangium sp. CS-033363 TaxID=3239935 RepID=UPI003D903D52